MKSGYGFIKRLNVDKEIFFHITQVQNGGDGGANEGGDNKDAKKVQIGDKVDFSIGQHDDREVASQIYILPKNFPMEFDQILQDPFSRQFVGKFQLFYSGSENRSKTDPGLVKNLENPKDLNFSMRRDFKLILCSRSVIDRRFQTRYLIR